jgi:hypothetical protein
MDAELEEYYRALGRLTFAASRLEAAMVVFPMALSDKPNELKAKLTRQSWKDNTNALRKMIKARFSPRYQARLLPFLDKSDDLREKRNDNIHALWAKDG